MGNSPHWEPDDYIFKLIVKARLETKCILRGIKKYIFVSESNKKKWIKERITGQNNLSKENNNNNKTAYPTPHKEGNLKGILQKKENR